MDQVKSFLDRELFKVDGMTFTVGVVALVIVIGYFVWFKK